jgi:hypothetical protein
VAASIQLNKGLSLMPFVLSAVMVLVITMLTIIFYTARTAVSNRKI